MQETLATMITSSLPEEKRVAECLILSMLFIDVSVLGNVGVGLGDIGLRLIVVIIAHKVLHGIEGKSFFNSP